MSEQTQRWRTLANNLSRVLEFLEQSRITEAEARAWIRQQVETEAAALHPGKARKRTPVPEGVKHD